MTPTDDQILHAMGVFGGHFVQALARAFYCADEDNRLRLKNAFLDYWEMYERIVIVKARQAEIDAALAAAEDGQ